MVIVKNVDRFRLRKQLRSAFSRLEGGEFFLRRMNRHSVKGFDLFPELFFYLKFGTRIVKIEMHEEGCEHHGTELFVKNVGHNEAMQLLTIIVPKDDFERDRVAKEIIAFFDPAVG